MIFEMNHSDYSLKWASCPAHSNQENSKLSQLVGTESSPSRGYLWLWFVSIILAVIAVALHFYTKQLEQDRHLTQERKVLQLLTTNLEEDLNRAISDVRFLQSRLSLIAKSKGLSESEKTNEAQSLLLQFAKHHPRYHQVRQINAVGKEVVRVEVKGNLSKLTTGQRLQSKSGQRYFQRLAKVSPQTVHISRFDFNREHGKIERPFRPVIRFSMPLYDNDNKFVGGVVINLNGEHLRQHLVSLDNSVDGHLSFVNGEGLWLFGEIDAETSDTRSDQLGTIWPMPVRNSRGVAQGKDRLYLHDVISYQRLAKDQSIASLDLEESFFKVVSTMPLNNLTPYANQRAKLGGPILLGLLLIAIIAAYRWHIVSQRQRRTVAKMARLAQIIEESQEIICLTDERGYISYVNPAFEQVTGYSQKECLGRSVNMLKSGYHDDSFYKQLWKKIESGQTFQSIFVNRRKDGSVYYEEKVITPFKSLNDGHRTYYFSSGHDVTELKHLKSRTKQLTYLAFHDSLTGLANRALLQERLEHTLATRRTQYAALLMLDLDGFKAINDAYGHPAGDKLLVQVGKRIRAVVREGDTVARLGGDEFALLLEQLATPDDVHHLAEQLLQRISAPLQLEEFATAITVSIGVTIIPPGSFVADDMVKSADQALYVAKEQGKNRFIVAPSDAKQTD
ncbi:diguanylate cyclase [Corallincola luteus]|uniref:Diguanylate cyclase n=1 Tax=Corallincola luteus TaxID=1775177 RepID=A0ABY2AG01_9GAMM|nr:diguanylate cyclase [Corallincola luteus]